MTVQAVKPFYNKLTDPITDIGIYVENLSKKILSEKNYAAFDFLKPNIANLQAPDSLSFTIALQQIESIIEELKKVYPDQVEIVEKLENILNSYKKMLKPSKK